MISTDYYEEHLNLLKTQMESQELQKQETSEALAALGDSLNIGLEKIAKAMPKENVTKVVIENHWWPQPAWWNGRWWYWTGYGWI